MPRHIVDVDGQRHLVNVTEVGRGKFEIQAWVAGPDDTGDSDPTPEDRAGYERLIRLLPKMPW